MLQQKRMLEEAAWSNPQIRQFLTDEEVMNPGLDVTLFDLVKTFQTILERARNRPTYEVTTEEVTVPEMIRLVREVIGKERGQPVSVTYLFESQRSRRAMLCLFLALLELVKRQAIVLQQSEAFGDISICASEQFDAIDPEQAIVAVEQEYN
jgi:segregation and condensation protein A